MQRERKREGNTPFLLQIIFYSWIFISFLFFFLPSLLEELSVSFSSSSSFSRLDSRDGANETFPLPLTSSPYVAGGKEESVKRLHANKLYLSIHLRRTLCLSPRNWQSNVKLIFSTLPSVISIRWKFQFFFFFFTRAKKGRRSRIPLHGDSLSEQFLENSSFLSPSYFFSSQWSSLRFRFHVSISQQVSSFHLDGDLSFLFIFPSSSSSSLSSSYRNAISSNESVITKLSRTKKRKRVYERIDERTFPRISTNLRENRRDFSLWKNFLGTRENLSPRSDLFGEGLDTWRLEYRAHARRRFVFYSRVSFGEQVLCFSSLFFSRKSYPRTIS